MNLPSTSGSKVKKALSVQTSPKTYEKKPNHSSNSQEKKDHVTASMTISIPELLYENQILKQELLKIKTENAILEEFKATYIEQKNRDITFRKSSQKERQINSFNYQSEGNSIPDYPDYSEIQEKEKENEKENEKEKEKNEEEIRTQAETIKIQSEEIGSLRGEIIRLEKILWEMRREVEMLKNEIEIQRHRVEIKNKEVQSLENSLDEYCALMKDQNMRIASLLKERINLGGELSRCASEAVSLSQFSGVDHKNDNKNEEQLRSCQKRLQDYLQIKDDNYRLRNEVAELMLANTALFQKSYRHTISIDHLWKIKQVEYANLHLELQSLKFSTTNKQK